MNYNNTKIYKITNTKDDLVYIGSTTKKNLNDRLWKHSSSSMDPKVSNYGCALYRHFRKYGQFEFDIELLEAYPCSSKREMVLREQEWMDKYDWDKLLNQRRAVAKNKMG